MTLDDALAHADRLFDPIEEQNLLDAETFVRDLGGTEAEVAAFMERRRGALARSRADMHESIRVAFWTPDGASVQVH